MEEEEGNVWTWQQMYMQPLMVLGELPPPKKVTNKACQTKPLAKQCASHVKIIHIFCNGKIDTLCSSALNGEMETRLHQISIPTTTAHGQQGTGPCKNPSKPTASSPHSLDMLCCPHRAMEHPATTTGAFSV